MVLQSLKIGNVLLFKNFKSRRKESLETLQILDMFIIVEKSLFGGSLLRQKGSMRGLDVSEFSSGFKSDFKVVYECNLYSC